MTPRLIALDGPRAGETITLDPGEFTIGREWSNALSLDDRRVSRRHCVVRADSDEIVIEDLESHNGVFVNRRPVRRATLADGDQIQIGNSLFLFATYVEPTDDGAPDVEFEHGRLLVGTTISLDGGSALYLHPERVEQALPAEDRVARDLAALLRIGTALLGVRDTKSIEQQVLDILFEVIPAERGAIVLADAADDFASVACRDRSASAGQPVLISGTAINRVLTEGVPLLCRDLLDGVAVGAGAAAARRVGSLLVVPLAGNGRVLGAVYLETGDPAEAFDEGHLQIVTAVAGVAALALQNCQYIEWLEGERNRLRNDLAIEHQMIGESSAMRDVYRAIQKVAHTDSTVLVRGESGTGKELVARAIHDNSPRASKPFVAINCATLTETLLESELFGYEKGAFTGAVAQRRGKLEVADGGTVFLDEIGEVPPALQAKLLRAIQERQFERVGGTRPVRVDVRWIAATNVELEQALERGRFRRDLFYRLNVISFTMPPLRERKEDIPLLASYFAAKYGDKCKRRVAGLSREARAALLRYAWPGNVRELENAVERAVVLGSTEQILAEDLPDVVLDAYPRRDSGDQTFQDAVADYKRTLVIDALEKAAGDFAIAAKELGLHPRYIYRLVKSLDIDPGRDLP